MIFFIIEVIEEDLHTSHSSSFSGASLKFFNAFRHNSFFYLSIVVWKQAFVALKEFCNSIILSSMPSANAECRIATISDQFLAQTILTVFSG